MNSCQAIRSDLAECIIQSDCVQKQGRSAQDCLQHDTDNLPMECKNIYRSYVHCKRGMLDMRKRFRGNAPPTSKYTANQGGISSVEVNTNQEGERVVETKGSSTIPTVS